MRGETGHYETSNSDWIRLHASIPSETMNIHKIISRNSTLSIPIKVYLQSLLSSSSNEVFFTAWTSYRTTSESVKSITLSWKAPSMYDMSNLLCFV